LKATNTTSLLGDFRNWEIAKVVMTGRNIRPLPPIDFRAINREALACLPAVLSRLLPGGHREGHEYRVRNPKRGDRNIGSFSINMTNGRWGDFAVDGAKGSDIVSLVAYLEGCTQVKAARLLVRMLGIDPRTVGIVRYE
jgi:hypothetical protein